MIEIKYAHLADYAGLGANGKPIVVGIFENIFARVKTDEGYPVPLSYLLVAMTGSITDAGHHRVEFHLMDSDGEPVWSPIVFDDIEFRPSGAGRPLSAIAATILVGMHLPVIGDYEFVVRVDDRRLGVVPLSLIPLPSAAGL